MNKFIEQQLKQLKVAEVERISATSFHIHKSNGTFQLNKCYLVELEDYIIHPSCNFTLASNWNRGVVPQYKTLQIVVTQILGKMIKVDAVAYDGKPLDVFYDALWLPVGGVHLLQEII